MESLRVVLLVGHLVAFALALSAVLRGDLLILFASRLHWNPLRAVSRQVLQALLLLAVTGAGLIWLDFGFEPQRMWASPKLLAKLSVVGLLLANAAVLHRLAFPALFSPRPAGRSTAAWISAAGAVSTTSWLFATFLGVARPLARELGYAGFMALYAAALAASLGVALLWVRPRLRRLMDRRAAGIERRPLPALRRAV